MIIAAGTRLGPYEIVSPIGAGGMGEVWRARDTRLDRSVAIKVVPREFAANAQFRLRFEREAKAISQLNHPNICTLHDVGEEKGTSYLVMELLEGESLADRIERGPLPLSEVLRYGVQIADGLDRAHRAGIVHRDLKPGNIMITRGGAKLLDFGLAKSSGAHVVEPPPPDSETELRAGEANRTPLTAEGTIIGTFQYMAPEQLEGVAADARTDIFALGAVLYEMATGRRAFQGKTRTSLIAAIVSAQPPAITNIQPLAPTSLDHVISTCLAKDPDDRWQSAHDVAQELRWVESSGSAMPAVAHRSPRLWMALAAAGLIAALVLGTLYWRERSRPVEPVSFSIVAPRGYTLAFPAIAPDGNAVAYIASNTDSGEQQIMVRYLGSVNPIKVTDAFPPPLTSLFWSPDGKWIGYFDHGKLLKVPSQGGRPETICSDCVAYGVGSSWDTDGTILFSPRFGEGIFRVPASGGTPVRVTSIDTTRRETMHGYPVRAADGDHFVYLIRTIADVKSVIYGGSLSDKTKIPLTQADSIAGIWKSYLLFVRDGALYGQRFDSAKLKLSGEPRKIVDDVFYDEDIASSGASVAANGALVYLPSENAQSKVEVGWYDRGGHLVEKLFDDVSTGGLALSPDDSRIALTKVDPRKGASDIWVYDIARGVHSKVTGGLSNHLNPKWTPDGQRIAFASDSDGLYDIYSQPDDGSTPPLTIWKEDDDKKPMSISHDGQMMLATRFSGKTKNDIWTVPLVGSGKPSPWFVTDSADENPSFSPNGSWVAFSSAQSGKPQVYVRPFPSGRSVQVSLDGGDSPMWSNDGLEIYFTTTDGNVLAVPFQSSGTTPVLGKPITLFHVPRMMLSWGPSHKAGRFIGSVRSAPEEVPVINFFTGWTDKLEQ